MYIYIRVYEYAEQCTMHIDIYKYIQIQTYIYIDIYTYSKYMHIKIRIQYFCLKTATVETS